MSASDTPLPLGERSPPTSDSVSQLPKRSLLAPSPERSVQSFEFQRASATRRVARFACMPVVCEQSRSQHIQQEFTMTKMTKAQLVDENIALRHNIALLEQQLVAAKGAARG